MASQSVLPALDVKTPQQPDLLEKYSQLQALRSAQQQQDIRAQQAPLQQQELQQNVQQGGLDIQQKQQALKDQQASTAALTEWDGKDINNLYPLILKNGGSANAVFTLKKQALDQQHTAAETFKNQADAGKAQIETMKQKNDLINGPLQALTDPSTVPDSQLPQALTSTVQGLVQQGLLDPQHAQVASQLVQSGDPTKIRQGIDQYVKTNMAQSQLLEEAHKTALEANQQQERLQAQQNAQQTAAHEAVDEKQGAQRLSIEGARLAFDKARQGTQDTQSIEAQAQQIADGDVKGLSQSRNNPYTRAVMSRVYEINPQYSDALYTGKQQFKTGADSVAMQGAATMLGHLQDSIANSDKIGVSPALNTRFQTPADAAYMKDVQLYTGEVGKLVTGKALTKDEGDKLLSGLDSFRPDVRGAALSELAKLSQSRIQAGFQKYKTATGQDLPVDKFFDAETRQNLQKIGVTQGGAKAAAAPQTHSFSLGAWQKANPNGDPKAAAAAAQQQGYTVTQ